MRRFSLRASHEARTHVAGNDGRRSADATAPVVCVFDGLVSSHRLTHEPTACSSVDARLSVHEPSISSGAFRMEASRDVCADGAVTS